MPQVEPMAIKCNLTTPLYSLSGATMSGRAEASLCNMTLALGEYMYHSPGSTARILLIESREAIIICQLVSRTTPSTASRSNGLWRSFFEMIESERRSRRLPLTGGPCFNLSTVLLRRAKGSSFETATICSVQIAKTR